MLTKGAIGNLVNRYRAVLKKCNLINTFGSLAVASMLVLGGSGVAEAVVGSTADNPVTLSGKIDGGLINTCACTGSHNHYTLNTNPSTGLLGDYRIKYWDISNNEVTITAHNVGNKNNTKDYGINVKGIHLYGNSNSTLTVDSKGVGIAAYGYIGKEDQKIGSLTINSSDNYGIYLIKTSIANTYDFLNIYASNISISSGSDAINSQVNMDIKADTFNINNVARPIRVASGAIISITANELNISNAKEEIKVVGTLNLKADSGNIESSFITKGDASTPSVSNLTFGSGVTLTGNITTDANYSTTNLTLNGATWNATGENTVTELKGDGSIVVDSADTTIAGTVANGSSISVKGSGKMNDAGGTYADIENAVTGLTGTNGAVNVAGLEEGLIAGAVDASGNQKVNTVMQDTLDMATTAPLAVGRIVMNDVRKRMGDLRSAPGEAGVWMRWDGGKLKGDEGLTNNFNTIQVGGDHKVGKNCRFGVAAAFTHGDLDHSNGNGEMETYSFSAYSTWMGDNGMFADVIARVGFTKSEISMKGQTIDLDNEALSLSAEYGWRFDLCKQFYVEPQVELTYTYLTEAESEVAYASYKTDSVDSLIGRAGLAAGWKLPNDMGDIYARASVVQEFLGDTRITGTAFGRSVPHALDGQDTWLEYGIGANIKLTDKTYIWADVERTEGADIDEEWRGTVGIRYSF